MKLIKVKQQDSKYYNFYILLENGSRLRIMPNKYKDSSNYSSLLLVAEEYEPR